MGRKTLLTTAEIEKQLSKTERTVLLKQATVACHENPRLGSVDSYYAKLCSTKIEENGKEAASAHTHFHDGHHFSWCGECWNVRGRRPNCGNE
eukprot:scaffold4534_cov85-Amphora_coffeaeformis.AAC.5